MKALSYSFLFLRQKFHFKIPEYDPNAEVGVIPVIRGEEFFTTTNFFPYPPFQDDYFELIRPGPNSPHRGIAPLITQNSRRITPINSILDGGSSKFEIDFLVTPPEVNCSVDDYVIFRHHPTWRLIDEIRSSVHSPIDIPQCYRGKDVIFYNREII